jgi:hypothetical protein
VVVVLSGADVKANRLVGNATGMRGERLARAPSG